MKTMGFWEVKVEVLENFQEEQLIVPLGFGLFKAKVFFFLTDSFYRGMHHRFVTHHI